MCDPDVQQANALITSENHGTVLVIVAWFLACLLVGCSRLVWKLWIVIDLLRLFVQQHESLLDVNRSIFLTYHIQTMPSWSQPHYVL